MLKERILLKSLYTMVFYLDNINIILLDKDQLDKFDFDLVFNEETKKINISREIFVQNYKDLTFFTKELKKINEVNIDDMINYIKQLDVNLFSFEKETKLNIELRNILESIINSKVNSLNILVLNSVLIEKFQYLFKTILIDLNLPDKDMFTNFVSTNIKQIEIKEKLFSRIEKPNNEEILNNLKNFIENLKSKSIEQQENDDDLRLSVISDDLDLNDEESIRELNERFDILNIMKPKETFDDIIGLKQIKEKLKNLVDLYKEDIESLNKYKIERDKGFILYGEPGTGKTMLCKAFAKELDAIFIYLSMEQFMSKKNDNVNINNLFEEIEDLSYMYPKHNIVAFLDEFDSLRARGNSEHNNSFYDGFTNEMLYRIDNLPKNVMIIGATNNVDTIDDAIKRKGRLGNQYEVKNNFKKEEIIDFVIRYFSNSNMKKLNKYAKEIATMIYYMNGSEIGNILNKIKQSYYFKTKFKKNIKIKDLIIDTIYAEKYNLADYNITVDEQLSTAYHEAGHALMYMYFYGTKDLHEISIYPTAKTLGFVSYKFEKTEVTKDDLKKLTLISLAGRYAEKLITNNISTGAISDLEKANEHIDAIISKYGMGVIENINRNKKSKSISEYMLSKMDQEHENLLKLYSSETEKIIKENKNIIEMIAQDLVKEKVIIDTFSKYQGMLNQSN